MNLLVVGERGQLARALREAATHCDCRLVAMGRPALDLHNADSIQRAIEQTRPEVVVNAAAYTAVDRAESEPQLAFAINADAVERLGKACASYKLPLIHISTDYVFDGAKPAPYTEADATNPINVYGQSKLAGEERLRDVNRRHIILRTSWLYSPYGHNFLRTMLRLAGEQQTISVVDDQTGNPTYAPHLADAILAIARQSTKSNDCGSWGTYHAAGTGEATWFGLAQELFSSAGGRLPQVPAISPIPTAAYPTAARRPPNSRLDCTQLHRHFGLKLPDWREGVRECIDRLLGADSTLEAGAAS